MREGGMFMSRRLSLSPVTIASYLPEPRPTLWGGGTNSSAPGKEVCLKLLKQVPLTFHLRILLVKLHAVGGFGGTREVFSGETRSQHAVCMHRAVVDASFRLTSA
jgi:hypothetical protein